MLRLILLSVIALFTSLYGYGKSDGWTIATSNRDNYSGVTLANGRIGIVSNSSLMSFSEIVLNGVFDKESSGDVSRMVRGPLFMNLKVKVNGEELNDSNTCRWEQKLNMHEAYLETSFKYKDIDVVYTVRAMRNMPYMAVGTLKIKSGNDADIEIINDVSFPSELKDSTLSFRKMRDGKTILPLCVSGCKSRTSMNDIYTSTAFLLTNDKRENVTSEEGNMVYNLRVESGDECIIPLAGAICTSRDFNDPKSESERMVIYALQHDYTELVNNHVKEWMELWKGDIEIEGCDKDQLDVRMALYNLYSFQRKGSRLSISPMGLSSSEGYNGHVFWDSEIWMFPPMLVLNPLLARCHLDYRYDRLDKAIQRAGIFGYDGAMFPWESDDSGEESTPTWCLTGTFEHHITADIGIAFWNYYCVTRDIKWLRNEGFKVISAVANFWVSRAVKNADGSYSIKNVVGADEYAQNVDDNAFTNASAKVALKNAVSAAQVLGLKPNKEWDEVSDNIKFHYMEDGTIKEHASYSGEMIKQADVNLLAYPLGVVTNKDAILRDINYYEDRIDKVNGPAMGSSILSILYSRLGHVEKGYEMFHKSFYPNKRPPFGALSESPSSNNPYFTTGAGGMLQAVIFGFAGLDITDKGLVQHEPCLPKQWKSLKIKGLGLNNGYVNVTR